MITLMTQLTRHSNALSNLGLNTQKQSDHFGRTSDSLMKGKNQRQLGSDHAKAVTTDCRNCQFPGERQKSTPCMTVRGLQRLLLILGGKVAAQYRAIVESVFTRYTAGDTSLSLLLILGGRVAAQYCNKYHTHPESPKQAAAYTHTHDSTVATVS